MINHIATKHKTFKEDEAVSNEDVSSLLKKQVDLFNTRQKELAEANAMSIDTGKMKGKTSVKRSDVIRAKIRTFARLNYMTTVLRKNAETIKGIKKFNPTGKLDLGSILGGEDELAYQY